MSVEVKVPTFPESVTDGQLVIWHKQVGEAVARDEIIAEIETDKVIFEVPAPENGVLEAQLVEAGATVLSEQALARINTEAHAPSATATAEVPPVAPPTSPEKGPAAVGDTAVSPSARKLMAEHGLDENQVPGSGKGGRVLKEDVLRVLESAPAKAAASAGVEIEGSRPQKRVPMTRLRARIAERLLESQHNAAILTTFNEVDMQPVMELRNRYKDLFEKEHGVRLGFMSFFVKACVEALKRFPEVNASIDGNDIVYHGFYDIGIAVGSPRGLVVPILRDADQMTIAEVEKSITDYAVKAKEGKLSLEEITGGTFSISNGGVFGSMLSTPILNPPQSAILGMHKVQERAMVVDGEIVARPMMYLALSYDHRIIDGREAVQFLVTIKNLLEDPARILLEI